MKTCSLSYLGMGEKDFPPDADLGFEEALLQLLHTEIGIKRKKQHQKRWEAAEEALKRQKERQTTFSWAAPSYVHAVNRGSSEPAPSQAALQEQSSHTATSQAVTQGQQKNLPLAQLRQEIFANRQYLHNRLEKLWSGNLDLGTCIKAIVDLKVSQRWSSYKLLCQRVFRES